VSSDGPALGQLVVSKMGRDKGKLFIVVRLVGGNYVYIADGSTHKMSDPKLKNKKHLILLDQIDQDIASRLTKGLAVTDQQLVTALRVYRPQRRKEGMLIDG
jgi:large subunit ribosomal protein L14e